MTSDYLIAYPERQHKHSFLRTITVFLTFCIAALVLVRDIGEVGLSRYIFIGIAALAFVVSDKYDIYCLFAFITPLASGISYTYISAIALAVLLFKETFLRKLNTAGLVCMLVILFLELVSVFRGMFTIKNYLRFASVFLLSFLRMLDPDTGYRNEKMLNYYLFGYFVAIASIIGQMLSYYSVSDFLRLGIRLGDTRQAFGVSTEEMLICYDPNGLGLLCMQAALLSLLQSQARSKRYYIAFIAATLFGIMTLSRTFFLVYFIAISLYIVFSCRTFKTAIRSLLSLAFGGICIYEAASRLIQRYAVGILERFRVEDLSNGRIEIMLHYFREMLYHPDRLLYGVGLQDYQAKYGAWFSAHNATQEVMIAWGLIGLAAVAVLFFLIYRNARTQNPKALLVQYVPLITTLIYLQTLQGFYDAPAMLRITVMFSVILVPMEMRRKVHNRPVKQAI